MTQLTCVAAQNNPLAHFLWEYVGECVHNNKELSSVLLGYISISFWIFAQLPQFIKNYKLGSAEALSPLFLFNWLLGDFANMIGSILTDQLPFQKYLAIYFCIFDCFMMGQVFLYKFRRRRYEIVTSDEEVCINGENGHLKSYGSLNTTAKCIAVLIQSQSAVGQEMSNNGNTWHNLGPTSAYKIGVGVSWTCAFLYFTSRWPQILKNFRTKKCQGLSLYMFGCAFMGNVMYVASVLTKSTETEYLRNSLPFLIGSGGTLIFDLTIFIQYFYYTKMYSGL